ncbi:FHA domain-containing protein [Myxococcota bacterium]|nr:FHA domain-containing protein [Myxococcota bacterium]
MKLRIHHPEVRGFTIPLDGHGIIVGREGGHVDLELNWDARISRRHMRLWREDGNFWFEDLGSRNGTWLGRRRLQGAYPLVEGVTILVGESELTLVSADEPEPESFATGDVEPLRPSRTPAPSNGALDHLKPGDTIEVVILPPELEDSIAPADLARDLLDAFASITPAPGSVALAVVPPPAPEPPPLAPRFVGDDRVLLSLPSRAELAALWARELSMGALFVPTAQPPRHGLRVQVLVDTPDGAIELAAHVVHVVGPELATAGMPSGAGLHVELSDHTRAQLQSYVDGRAAGLELAGAPAVQPSIARADVDRGIARVRELITHFEENDVYGGLELPPTASPAELARRFDELRTLFIELQRLASPPQLARISAADRLLQRAEVIMTDPERRLEHDFRQGHVRAEERIAAARHERGPAVAALREAWNRALPERHDKALVLMREVVTAKKAHDVVKALRLAHAALELDPFNEDLRRAIDAWQRHPDLAAVRAG